MKIVTDTWNGETTIVAAISEQIIEPKDCPRMPVSCEIKDINGSLFIYLKGYGEHGTENGYGAPVVIEMAKGRLRALIWTDINKQDPMIVDLEGAAEANRTSEDQ